MADTIGELELEIKFLNERINTTKENLTLLIAERDTARKLQASEYERRLTELNGAHERAAALSNEFATKETVVKTAVDLNTKIDSQREYLMARIPAISDVNRAVAGLERIDKLEKENSEQRGRLAVMTVILSIATPAISVLVIKALGS